MSLRIEFLSGADADLQAIFEGFEEYQDGFGVEFLNLLNAYLGRISDFPEIAPIYSGEVRRQVMRTFPFGVFYLPQPRRILVVAILDLRQNPNPFFAGSVLLAAEFRPCPRSA